MNRPSRLLLFPRQTYNVNNNNNIITTSKMATSSPPFPRSCALDHNRLLLVDVDDQTSGRNDSTGAPPISHLPGDPTVGLGAEEVNAHFDSSFATPVLDELRDHLYLVALPDKDRIDALNRQRAQGRTIVATNDPSLHLNYSGGKNYVQAILCLLAQLRLLGTVPSG